MPFFKNISLEVSGNDFNLNTKVNKQKTQISNLKFQKQMDRLFIRNLPPSTF